MKAVECPVCKYRRLSFKRTALCNHNQDEEGIPVPVAKMRDVYAQFCTEPNCDAGLVAGEAKVCPRCKGVGLEP